MAGRWGGGGLPVGGNILDLLMAAGTGGAYKSFVEMAIDTSPLAAIGSAWDLFSFPPCISLLMIPFVRVRSVASFHKPDRPPTKTLLSSPRRDSSPRTKPSRTCAKQRKARVNQRSHASARVRD